MRVFIFLLAVILLSPCVVAAHGENPSLEAVLPSGALVDIGYSSAPVSEESTIFDFSVKDANGEEIVFDRIWVRLGKGSAAYLATGIVRAEIGKTVLTYRFGDAGAYELAVRFEKEGKTVAEHTFALEVGKAEASKMSLPFDVLLSILAAFLAGGALTYVFFPRTR